MYSRCTLKHDSYLYKPHVLTDLDDSICCISEEGIATRMFAWSKLLAVAHTSESMLQATTAGGDRGPSFHRKDR
jgi:hypothetical protein